MPVTTEALLVLAQNYAGNLVAQVNRRSVALSILAKNEDEGKNVAWGARGSGAAAEAFTSGSDVSSYTLDSQSSATLSWACYRNAFALTDLARAVSRSSRTPEANINLLAQKVGEHVEALASKLNTELYIGAVGQTPEQVTGLDAAIGSVSNTYATIDRSDSAKAFFRPYVVDPGSATALTFAQIRTDLAEIYKTGGVRPNLMLVGPTTHAAIASLYDPQKQYVMQTMPIEQVARELPMYQGGAGVLRFDGCMIVEDKDATEGKLYYLNTDAVSIQYLPMAEPGPGENDEIAHLASMNDGFNEIPLGLRMRALAAAGDADKIMLYTYVQLRVKRPNQCGVRKNVAYS